MLRTIAIFSGEGFKAMAVEQKDKSIVIERADADIDADGANGQNGAKAAYMIDDKGSELLANGGMGMHNGRVVGIHSWFKDIVILDDDDDEEPKVFPGGIIVSRTAYKWSEPKANAPDAYLDSETVAYICVPPEIQNGVEGIVLGCKCIVFNRLTGKQAEGVVGDIGPRHKIGEISIEMARLLGINPSPRSGGEDRPMIDYMIYPGVFGRLGQSRRAIPLQTAKGKYIVPISSAEDIK